MFRHDKTPTKTPVYDQKLHEQLAALGLDFPWQKKYVPSIITDPFHGLLKNEINVATKSEFSTENWGFLMALYHINTTDYAGSPADKARAVHLSLLEVIDNFLIKVHVHTDVSELDKKTAKQLKKIREAHKETEEDKTALQSPAYKERMRPHAFVEGINVSSEARSELIKKVDPDYEEPIEEKVDKHKFAFPPVVEKEKTGKHLGEVYATLPSQKTDTTTLLAPSDFLKAADQIADLIQRDSFGRYVQLPHIQTAVALDEQVKFILDYLDQFLKGHAKHRFFESEAGKAMAEVSKTVKNLEEGIDKLYKEYSDNPKYDKDSLPEFQKQLKALCEEYLDAIPKVIANHPSLTKGHSPEEISDERTAVKDIEKLTGMVTQYATGSVDAVAKFIDDNEEKPSSSVTKSATT